MTTTPLTRQDLIDFVVHEAHLLDTGRFDEWNALFAPEAMYWVPLSPEQPDGVNHASYLYEDALLRTLRIQRLKNPRAHSQQPPSRCQHVLQQPVVELFDEPGNRYVIRTAFHYAEARDGTLTSHVGTARHHLSLLDGGLRITLKRVDLLLADTPLPALQLFI